MSFSAAASPDRSPTARKSASACPRYTNAFCFSPRAESREAAAYKHNPSSLVQKAGMSTPKHLPAHDLSHMKFFPNFFLRELMVWYGVLALLGSLADRKSTRLNSSH